MHCPNVLIMHNNHISNFVNGQHFHMSWQEKHTSNHTGTWTILGCPVSAPCCWTSLVTSTSYQYTKMEECVFLQTSDMLKLFHIFMLQLYIPLIPTFLSMLGYVLAYLVLLLLTWLENVLVYGSVELWQVSSISCASLLSERSRLLRIHSKCVFVLLFLSKYYSSHFLLPLIPCRGALSKDLLPHSYAQMWVNVRTQNWLHYLGKHSSCAIFRYCLQNQISVKKKKKNISEMTSLLYINLGIFHCFVVTCIM